MNKKIDSVLKKQILCDDKYKNHMDDTDKNDLTMMTETVNEDNNKIHNLHNLHNLHIPMIKYSNNVGRLRDGLSNDGKNNDKNINGLNNMINNGLNIGINNGFSKLNSVRNNNYTMNKLDISNISKVDNKDNKENNNQIITDIKGNNKESNNNVGNYNNVINDNNYVNNINVDNNNNNDINNNNDDINIHNISHNNSNNNSNNISNDSKIKELSQFDKSFIVYKLEKQVELSNKKNSIKESYFNKVDNTINPKDFYRGKVGLHPNTYQPAVQIKHKIYDTKPIKLKGFRSNSTHINISEIYDGNSSNMGVLPNGFGESKITNYSRFNNLKNDNIAKIKSNNRPISVSQSQSIDNGIGNVAYKNNKEFKISQSRYV